MKAPLTNFQRLSKKEFFTDIDARQDEYFNILKSVFDLAEEKVVDGEKGVFFYTADGEKTLFIKDSDLQVVECYDEIERHEMILLKEKVYSTLDESKTELYIRYMVKELTHIRETIETFVLDEFLTTCKVAILAKLQDFSKYIEESYLNLPQTDKTHPKIQWLGDTKLLTTLFYDLMNGNVQEKKGIQSGRKLIRAKAADMIRLIASNFLDKNGDIINPNSLKSYFKESDPTARVPDEKKIELFLK